MTLRDVIVRQQNKQENNKRCGIDRVDVGTVADVSLDLLRVARRSLRPHTLVG